MTCAQVKKICLGLPEAIEQRTGRHASSHPDRYFIPSYVGPRGWVGLYLDVGPVDWDEVDDLVVDGYLLVAPKRLAALVDI